MHRGPDSKETNPVIEVTPAMVGAGVARLEHMAGFILEESPYSIKLLVQECLEACLSQATACESPFHAYQDGENGTVQVSAAKGSVGLMVERSGLEQGVVLTASQAAALARSLRSASTACDAPQSAAGQ